MSADQIEQGGDQGAELSGEMRALMMQADDLDGEAHATSAEGVMEARAEEQATDATSANAREVRMILAMLVPMAGAAFPSVVEIYTDQQCDLVAASLAPVMTKYGINLGTMSDRPELAALMICGPLAFATYQGVKGDIAARKQLPKRVPGNSQPAPVEKAPEVLG